MSKQDIRYFLNSYSREEIQQTNEYIALKRHINRYGYFSIAYEGEQLKVYSAELMLFLKSEEVVAENLETNTDTIISGKEYLDSYLEGFKRGIEYFKNRFTSESIIIYGSNSDKYIQTLHHHYYHSSFDGHEGWNKVKGGYPFIITKKAIVDYGYYSGIVSTIDDLKQDHLFIFKEFDKCTIHAQHEVNTPEKENQPPLRSENFTLEWLCDYKCASPVKRANAIKEVMIKFEFLRGKDWNTDLKAADLILLLKILQSTKLIKDCTGEDIRRVFKIEFNCDIEVKNFRPSRVNGLQKRKDKGFETQLEEAFSKVK